MGLPWPLSLTLGLLPDLLGQIALFNKSVKLLGVFLAVLVVFVWIISFKVDCQKFKGTFFGTEGRVFRSSVA